MDHVEILAAQKNDAGRKFGLTGIKQGKNNPFEYANLTGFEAGRLAYYWRGETDALKSKITFGLFRFTTGIPTSAHKEKWLRDKANFDVVAPRIVVSAAINQKLKPSDAALFWQLLDNVVLPMSGLATTPSRWDLGVESAVEAATEFGTRFEQSSWLMPALYIAGGLLLYNTFFAPSARR
jgi:hypothetical protein